jgi:hypothetical protein
MKDFSVSINNTLTIRKETMSTKSRWYQPLCKTAQSLCTYIDLSLCARHGNEHYRACVSPIDIDIILYISMVSPTLTFVNVGDTIRRPTQ